MSLVHALAFQGVWFLIVAAAARGHGWVGPVLGGLFALIGLRASSGSSRKEAELRLLAVAACAGLMGDSILSLSGLLRFEAPLPVAWIAPPWVLSLWIGFATLLPRSLGWLTKRPLWLASVLGALVAPLSYLGAARMGAAEASSTLYLSLAVGVEYALAFPLLVWLARAAREPEVAEPEESATEAR